MRKVLMGLVLVTMLTGTVFAEGIHPVLCEFGASILPEGAVLISMSPNTQQAADIYHGIRHGEYNGVITERNIGPSRNRISSATLDAHMMHGMVVKAARMNSYVRGEAYTLVYDDDMATEIATEIIGSIVFAETLKNVREMLKLTYSFRTIDGSTLHGVSFWLTADTAQLDTEIREIASYVSSGNQRNIERRTTSTEQKTTEVRTRQERPVTDTASSAQSRLSSNERILRFREENKRLLGFDE
ncbi:MAG: hypothetical protein FWD26_07890 [Treponema sp.]|nr:hypothetical protein [Treponema sp.]